MGIKRGDKTKKPNGFYIVESLDLYTAEADKLGDKWNITDKYSSGMPLLDKYMGGGFGQDGMFELVVVYGAPGSGKSTLAMQLVKDSLVKGVPQAWIVLEDSMVSVNVRFRHMFNSDEEARRIIKQKVKINIGGAEQEVTNPIVMSNEMVESNNYTLGDILDWIEMYFKAGVEIVLLDHLQYAVDGADRSYGDSEFDLQSDFAKELATVAKRYNKVIIAVTHTNKGNGAGDTKIYGSKKIEGAATKTLEISRIPMNGEAKNNRSDNFLMEPDYVKIQMNKSRYTEDRKSSVIYLHRASSSVSIDGDDNSQTFGFDYAVEDFMADKAGRIGI